MILVIVLALAALVSCGRIEEGVITPKRKNIDSLNPIPTHCDCEDRIKNPKDHDHWIFPESYPEPEGDSDAY